VSFAGHILKDMLALVMSVPISAASTAGVSLDELSTSQQMDEIVRRVFPLSASAISWEDVPWRSFEKIIISGPQRSGTTFFAAALAKHVGYVHADENMHLNLTSRSHPGVKISLSRDTPFGILLDIQEKVVLQRPTWSHRVHKLLDGITEATRPFAASKVFVGFVARNCLDVYRSQNKAMQAPYDTGWTCKFGRTAEWSHYHSDPDLLAAIEDEHDMICTIKQQAYLNHQRSVMDRIGIRNAPIAFSSFHSLDNFAQSANRTNLSIKELAGSLNWRPGLRQHDAPH